MSGAGGFRGPGSKDQDETLSLRLALFGEDEPVAVSPRSYGIRYTIPVHAAAWYSPARTLIGNGSSMYGAQLPGR